ncbi:MAG: polyprenyl diphosphate synthase [Gammaproteobacteria bacterium]|nr:polyprenyl diphosphate synthase [Gammaproteobacteria bacterium]MDH5241055.1 polyprenyl diphosphate synthase [Gammaproteobacteria bacterium]MDH5261309.1 polyprenyl diphosphate synthase [Gammaproteobacteria bacterium]MDH5583342.1 polyprenyl diphosphate synthase [Gammaproteobacteria bacterium]
MDSNVPRHIAIIMDGNGRWANARGKPRRSGHRAGVKSVRASVETAAQRGVEFLTLFAFSSENWSRPDEEVSSLMSLFVEALRREVDELHRNNVKLKFVGALDELSPALKKKIAQSEEKTAGNTGLHLTVAVAYGGRWDIVQATRAIAGRVAASALRIDDIDDAEFASELALSGLPDPDLLIRTGGERRISNFLLWNLAYSELWFTDVLWPEFDATVFDEALFYYAGKQRRFGHTGDQVESI